MDWSLIMKDWTRRMLKHYFAGHWRYMLRHWFPLALLGVVWAFIAGLIGSSFGVPLLFRDDPAYDYLFMVQSLNRPSIAGYTAATVLLLTVLAVVYIFEIVGAGPRRSVAQSVRKTVSFFAIAGALPLFVLLLAAALPFIDLADSAPVCAPENTYCQVNDPLTSGSTERASLFHPDEGGKALFGILIGGLIAFACGSLIFWISIWIERIGPAVGAAAPWLSRRLGWFPHLFSSKARRNYPLMLGTVASLLLITAVLLLAPSLGVSLAAIARPGAAICIFFGVIVVFYFLVLLLAPSLRFIGVIAFLAFHAFIGADHYINEFPGFEASVVNEEEQVTEKTNYYDCLLPLTKSGNPVEGGRRQNCADKPVEKVQFGAKEAPEDRETPTLLTAKEWVGQWGNRKGPEEGPRHLVVIATQGGAYRASFWTSLILDELAERDRLGSLEGLIDQTGLLTGASGGMVASAYFTIMGTKTKDWPERHGGDGCGMNAVEDGTWSFGPVTSQLCQDIFNTNDATNPNTKFTSPRPIARDSLTPVAAQTVLYDIPRVLSWPLTSLPGVHALLGWDDQTYHDRGLILERQWGTLHKSYGELARQQQAMRREGQRHPSMIISPMIADTGQPILISNLDLQGLVNNSTKEAVSLFDWFPDIREDFRVQTAVRMNASFPYISPAVSLPTTARRRVVDAGYYDNYGVNTAVSWLFQDEVMEVLADPDSGIDGLVFIQIRAFPGRDQGQVDAEPGGSENAKTEVTSVPRDKEKHKADLPLIPEWLTSPLAGVLSARSGSMAYRNDSQIERLTKVLQAKGRSPDFVQSIIFENHADPDQVGVSWHITPNELQKLESELRNEWNCEQFDRLEQAWRRPAPASAPAMTSELIALPVETAYQVQPAADQASSCGGG